MRSKPAHPLAVGQAASTNIRESATVNGTELQEENPQDWLDGIPNKAIFAYNLDGRKNPRRAEIRVAAGTEGTRWDARQAEAIKELLQWAQRHQRSTPQTT